MTGRDRRRTGAASLQGGPAAWPLNVLAPDEVADRVADIDLDALRARGLEGLLLDVDNTLVPWASCEMDESTEEWVRRAKQHFAICLLSNSVRGKRMRRLTVQLDLPGVSVWGGGRKPFTGGFMQALRRTGTESDKTAMVGDQLLADVLGGNRCGMYTIWVKLINEREFVSTRLARVLERFYVRKLEAAGLLPGSRPSDPGPRTPD